jgi:hypothetical protein
MRTAGNPEAKSQARQDYLAFRVAQCSNVGFGLAQAGNAVARFPLAAPLKHFQSFEALEDIPFAAQSSGCAQAAML